MPISSEEDGGFNRVYKNKTRLRGLKIGRFKLCYFLESAEADIVCVDAVSTAVFLESAEADIVCVDAVSTAVFLESAEADIVCVDAVSTAV